MKYQASFFSCVKTPNRNIYIIDWSIDGHQHYATMHIVTDADGHAVKEKVREVLREYGIVHVTLELETCNDMCEEEQCHVSSSTNAHHCAYHH